MFKKTLTALAVAALSANAVASTIDAQGSGSAATNPQLISIEGSQSSVSFAITGTNEVNVNTTGVSAAVVADYATLEKIQVVVTGGTLTPATDFSVDFKDGVAAAADITLGTASYPNTTTAILTIADGAGGLDFFDGDVSSLAAGDLFELSGLSIAPAGGAFDADTEVSVTVSFLSSVGGAVIDTATGVIADMQKQFSTTVSASLGDTDIDVGNSRLTFEGKVATDTASIKLADAKVDLLAADATAGLPKYTLNGSLAFLDADDTAGVDAGTITTTTTSPTVAADLTSVEETAVALATFDGAAATDVTESFTLTVDGKTHVLPVQSFTADVEFAYVDAASTAQTYAVSGLAAGSFALNGASAQIDVLPFSSEFSQFVTVTNTGAVDGAITVDWSYNGSTFTQVLTTYAAPYAVTDISAELREGAAAYGIVGNAALNIVVNSPKGDIAVKGLYYSKADADRAVVK